MLNQDLFYINVYYIQLQLGMNIQFKFRKIFNTFCRNDKQVVVVIPTKKGKGVMGQLAHDQHRTML